MRAYPKVERPAWAPQPGPQADLVDCPAAEIFFGGARGGGKTDGMLGKWLKKESLYGEAFSAMMFRRTTVSSTDAIERAKQIYGPAGGKFNETRLFWRMPNGGRVGFGYLDSVDDAQEYQGRNLTDAWIEEAGQYPTPDPIFRLFGALRSSAGVPTQLVLTGNPGGPGQSWIRERYEMVPFPPHGRVLRRALPDGSEHQVVVIPSRLTDNKLLMHADPSYVQRLMMVGSARLVSAWLDGDWNAVEGAFFDEWDEKRHVVTPFPVPQHWLRFRSMDWGSAAPFSVGWWAVASDDCPLPNPGLTGPGSGSGAGPGSGSGAGPRFIPRGALVRYREWYGASEPNKGLKLTAEAVGRGIQERSQGESIAYGVLDPSAFAESGGPSIAEMMRRIDGNSGPRFRRADNTRVGKLGAASGWMAVRSRLRGNGEHPMLFVFSTCVALIRTLPLLQHDPDRGEDLDTGMEDHAADETRYACMSRPWIAPTKPEVVRSRNVLDGYSDIFPRTKAVSILTL